MHDNDDPLARWLTGAVEDATPDAHDVQGAGHRDGADPAAGAGPDAEDPTNRPRAAPDLPDEPAAPRRRLVVGAAIGVWLVLGLLLVVRATVGVGDEGSSGATDVASPGGAAASTDQAGAPAASGDVTVHDSIGSQGSDDDRAGANGELPTGDADDAELTAAATTALRLALVGADPGAGDEAVRYIDHAVAESVERHGQAAVVVVRAVFLHGSGADWDRSRPARWAVPLRVVDGRAVPAGAPWPLAPPTTSPRTFGWTALDDRDVEGDVLALLAAAGWTISDVQGLSIADELDGIVRAEVTGRAPGELGEAPHEVWFVADGGVLRVAGERPAAARPADPQADPPAPAADHGPSVHLDPSPDPPPAR